MQSAKVKAENQIQKNKLVNSYNELLSEFSSTELKTVGNYTLGRLVGKGSFGKVYLAKHKLTNGSKVVLKSANKDDSNLAREIHHHRQFLHPHIARLYEVIVTEKLVWLALEYCPGDELYNYLLKHGPLPAAKVQKIFAQLVGAVSYVHKKQCVHRDLKLENILLDKNENVKLVDFGFTREYDGKAAYLQTFCGTVCYSAPEMLKGEKYAGEKVDVWSLGVILYALLTAELPFDDDDEGVTRTKILTEEPTYSDELPEHAIDLIKKLLSKRTLVRPTLDDVLNHPFLAEHAATQREILETEAAPPFTTTVEKDCLKRLQAAGVDLDQLIENVLAKKCDCLAGWWALLLEKAVRKETRREQKRIEREKDLRVVRRLSAASSRRDRTSFILQDVDEETGEVSIIGEVTRGRPRSKRKSSTRKFMLKKLSDNSAVLWIPSVPVSPRHRLESPTVGSISEFQPPRSASSSRTRPPLPPKELRGSQLQIMTSNPDLINGTGKRRRRKHQLSIINQLASIKHWFLDSTKRGKSPGKSAIPEEDNKGIAEVNTMPQHRPPQPSPQMRVANYSHRVPSQPKRTSISPAPLTPHSSTYRRSSAGLRGRKSTSSSLSSIRSMPRHYSHSKASSTSSAASIKSVKTPRSPKSSVKVLPATPTTSSFPSNIRVVRSGNEPFAPTSLGLVFAKRKKSPFKGPMLNVGNSARRDSSVGRSASVGRRSGEIIEEEDEEVEEVDRFSPMTEHGEDHFSFRTT